MIKQFTFTPLPRLFFGIGRVAELSRIIHQYGNTVLLVLGANSFRKTDHWPRMQEAMSERGLTFYAEQITGEPSPEVIDDITSKYRDRGISVVTAIGGGSVLDGGKAIAAMLPVKGSVINYLEGVGNVPPDGSKVPFVAVPTTAGTGSEVTCNAVISKVGRKGFKKSLRHENYMPDVAVIDPDLTVECPEKVTVNCAMDCFSQLVESYLSTKASPMTDDLAYGAIKRLQTSLWRICRGEGDLEDRTNLSYGACISGVTLTNAGLGVVHGFASAIGGLFPIPHGVVCGTLLAVANEVSLRKLRASGGFQVGLSKYAELGRIFSDKDRAGDQYYQDSFIDMLGELTSTVQPDLLSDYGVGLADIEAIVSRSSSKNNPVSLEPDEMMEIIVSRLS
jgi:alcohol dehydrogenase